MRFRHTPFFNLLETLRQRGCPFCALAVAAGRRYLETTLYEFVNDAKVRRTLVDSRGFCREHARSLHAMADPPGIALLHERLLHELLEAPAARLFRPPRAPCPACLYAEDAVRSAMGTFLDSLDEPEISDYCRSSPGICLPHRAAMANLSRKSTVRHLLAEIARRRLHRLLEDVRRLAQERNATLTQRPDPSRTSYDRVWSECLEFFSGTADFPMLEGERS